MMIIVTGVPGTGKSFTATRLAERLRCKYLNISWLVLEKGLWEAYDPAYQSFIVDFDALVRELRRAHSKEQCIVFDTHWVEPVYEARLPVLKVIVLRAHPLVLAERLKRRHWPPRKIAENVEAELLGVITTEAMELYRDRVWEIDTTGKGVESTVAEAENATRTNRTKCCIDWLSQLTQEEFEKTQQLITHLKNTNPGLKPS